MMRYYRTCEYGLVTDHAFVTKPSVRLQSCALYLKN